MSRTLDRSKGKNLLRRARPPLTACAGALEVASVGKAAFPDMQEFIGRAVDRRLVGVPRLQVREAQNVLKKQIDLYDTWIADHWRSIGMDLDLDILQLPGGALIAALLWIVSKAFSSNRRCPVSRSDVHCVFAEQRKDRT
jgi:hypothetical protein